MPRMQQFTMLPTAWWLRDDRMLRDFTVREVPALKALFALAILGGAWREGAARRDPAPDLAGWFPAPLDDITTEAHLARDDGARAARILVQRGLLERRDDLGRRFNRGTGAASYHFVQRPGVGGFFPFPYAHASDSRFLASIRATPAAAAALKLYLTIGTFRENRSGLSMVSYDKFEEYGAMERRHIRGGLSLLIQHRLVDVYAPAVRGSFPTRYFVQGLSTTPPMNAGERQVVSEADLPF